MLGFCVLFLFFPCLFFPMFVNLGLSLFLHFIIYVQKKGLLLQIFRADISPLLGPIKFDLVID